MAALATAIMLGGAASGAATPAEVQVSLQDASTGGDVHGMQMLAEAASVAAGPVTFHAANRSKTLVHEMLVVKVANADAKLPYNTKTSEVVENRVKKLGEIPDLRPGASGTLTLDLAPGSYRLLCNQPGHYKQGMWTAFTVTR